MKYIALSLDDDLLIDLESVLEHLENKRIEKISSIQKLSYLDIRKHLKELSSLQAAASVPYNKDNNRFNMIYWLKKTRDLMDKGKEPNLSSAITTVCTQAYNVLKTQLAKLTALEIQYKQHYNEKMSCKMQIKRIELEIFENDCQQELLESSGWFSHDVWTKKNQISSTKNMLFSRKENLEKTIEKYSIAEKTLPKLSADINNMRAQLALIKNIPAAVLSDMKSMEYSSFLQKNKLKATEEKSVCNTVDSLQKNTPNALPVNPNITSTNNGIELVVKRKILTERKNELDLTKNCYFAMNTNENSVAYSGESDSDIGFDASALDWWHGID